MSFKSDPLENYVRENRRLDELIDSYYQWKQEHELIREFAPEIPSDGIDEPTRQKAYFSLGFYHAIGHLVAKVYFDKAAKIDKKLESLSEELKLEDTEGILLGKFTRDSLFHSPAIVDMLCYSQHHYVGAVRYWWHPR